MADEHIRTSAITDGHIRISWDVGHASDIIHLPKEAYHYFDTQAGALDIGLDREWMKTLHMMMGEWLLATRSVAEGPQDSEELNDPCSHEEAWFDRSVCPEPCGSMHNYCCACSKRLEPCLFSDVVESLRELREGNGVPARTRNEEQNELCWCGHAAMVHTSGSGNCLAFGTSDQRSSHCLEFVPAKVDEDYSDACCSGTCTCENAPMDPVEAFEPCLDCGHATQHGVGDLGDTRNQHCEAEGCNCTGREILCDECPHSFWQHQQGDGGCPSCGCRVGERVRPPEVLRLCDQCHGEVYTFPRTLISLGQRLHCGAWAAFSYTDDDGDELLIYPHHGNVMISAIATDGMEAEVRIPLGVLEAVVSAVRETGHRAAREKDV